VLVPRYKLSLCHTSIKPDLVGFPGIDIFECGLRDHVIMRLASFGIRAWLQKFGILLKFLFIVDSAKKKFLSIQFLLLLEFAAYKKKLLFHSVIVQNISVASKKKKKKEKNKKKISFKKDVYWILPQKTKQEKIGSNQLGISSNLIL